MRIPMPMSPVVNGIRHRERIIATLDAVHLHGLPLEEGKTVVAELLAPLKNPQVPENDLRFAVPSTAVYTENSEPVLSFYADGWEGRRVLPLSMIHGLALIPGDTDLSAQSFTPESPLGRIAARCARPCRGGWLVLRCAGEDPAGTEDIILLFQRTLRQAQQAADYYFQHIHPGETALTLTQLGI